MPRPRSRSPRRRSDRKRSRSRSRSRERRERRRERDRRRSRSRSPSYRRRKSSRSPPMRRNLSRSSSREVIILSGPGSSSTSRDDSNQKLSENPQITEADMEGKTEEEIDMMKLMGFSNFDTTKGKHVNGNDSSGVHVIQKRKYRQYMNRRGGFNRPLDFVA